MIGENNLMGNMVTNVCVKFNYDRLRIDKALGNCKKASIYIAHNVYTHL